MLRNNELQMERSLGASRTTEADVPGRRLPARKGKGLTGTILTLVVVAILAFWGLKRMGQQRVASATNSKPAAGPGGRAGALPVPIVPGVVTTQDMPIFLDGLGNVQAFNTVTLRSRVDGQVQKILFTEGQDVHAGDLLAQIDPAPFQAQLDQNIAKKAQDEAQLAVAQLTLKRDKDLLVDKILAQQDYDTQSALVDQLVATVKADQAAIESAQVQLNYTRILAPLDARAGLRQVDQGNIVHATDSSGIVVLTQLRPISVVFSLAEKFLGDIQRHANAGDTLTVVAVDRNNSKPLGEGKLAVVNNQIDTTTGTIQLKATFPNEDLRLWPGQFVNARLLLTEVKNATVVPAQAIQRGPDGAYVFVIKPDSTVDVKAVKVGPPANVISIPIPEDSLSPEQGKMMVQEGLKPGEKIVVDGQYKLQRGSRVRTGDEGPKGTPGGQKNKRGASQPSSSAS
jgi:multidrug efflux system membrane fusion protein